MAVNVSNRVGNVKNKRSHALNATKKKQKVNLQKVTVNGEKVILSAGFVAGYVLGEQYSSTGCLG